MTFKVIFNLFEKTFNNYDGIKESRHMAFEQVIILYNSESIWA